MSLRGIEVMAKISGEGAKHLAVYLFAVLQGQKQTRGRTRLENLLRSGKELKVFAVRNEDLPTFCKEAKRYGVLYCALRDKKSVDGMCDVMVRAEDASKINRIVERFQLATVDTASIKNEIEQARQEKQAGSMESERAMEAVEHKEPQSEEPEVPATAISEEFLDELLGKQEPPEGVEPGNEVLEGELPVHEEPLDEVEELEYLPLPSQSESQNQPEPLSPSAPTSAHSVASETILEQPKQKVSVRQLLREIREENRAAEKQRQQQQQEREPGLPKRKGRGKAPVAVNAPVETPNRSNRKRGKAK
ncbi:PcfB family protein [Paenibacillus sp. MSJ-6]|uniref:PcfB family protein n=2 Tax=Paenibacillus brevis TaxID=2841508 RepID=A0ABS6FPV6_9BACL|nr:PcfB family protein [Paenibacillus brevis]